MPTIDIPHQPELTKQKLQEIFSRGLSGTYEIASTAIIGADFVVKKDEISGAFIKLKQLGSGTSVSVTGGVPNMLLRMLFFGIFSFLTGRGVVRDVCSFLESSGEINLKQAPAETVVAVPRPDEGRCPNCNKIIARDSLKCVHCSADFGPTSAWKIE